MRTLSLLLFCLLAFSGSYAQQSLTALGDLQPPEDFENIHVTKVATDERASVFVIWVKNSVRAHRHETHSESVYVLEGTAKMTLGDETFEVKAGDYIYIPMNAVHAVEVTSEEPAKVLSIQAPEFLGKDRVFVEE